MHLSSRLPMVRRRVVCDALSRETASYVWPAAWLRQHERALVGGDEVLRDVMVAVGRATFELCQSLLLQRSSATCADGNSNHNSNNNNNNNNSNSNSNGNNSDNSHAATCASRPRTWLVLVGAGNNGGDALEVAYHAVCAGHCVHVYRMPSSKPPPREAALALHKWQSLHDRAVTHTVTRDTRFDAAASWDMIVDGLLGIGTTGSAVRDDYARVIACVNALRATTRVVAIDVPSGLDSESGHPLGGGGVCVRAHATFAPLTLKPGLLLGHARAYVGQLYYSNMGYGPVLLPPPPPPSLPSHEAPAPPPPQQSQWQAAARMRRYGCEDLPRFFATPRSPLAHKGSHGRVLLLGGDVGYGGAIVMAAEAAVSAGAGLTRVLTARGHAATALLTRCPEAMVTELPVPNTNDNDDDSGTSAAEGAMTALQQCITSHLMTSGDGASAPAQASPTVVAIGPGLGRGALCTAAMRALLAYAQQQPDAYLVLDADALNALADMLYADGHSDDNSRGSTVATSLPRLRHSVMTPHPGEAARLLRCSVADVEADRVRAARRLAAVLGGVCVLKGACTIVCQDTSVHNDNSGAREGSTTSAAHCACIDAGNAGMATGGMGDVLTGVVTALVAQYATSSWSTSASALPPCRRQQQQAQEGQQQEHEQQQSSNGNNNTTYAGHEGAPASLFDAVCAAVLAHGVAADVAVEAMPGRGTRGLRATELLPYIPLCINAGVVPVDVSPLP